MTPFQRQTSTQVIELDLIPIVSCLNKKKDYICNNSGISFTSESFRENLITYLCRTPTLKSSSNQRLWITLTVSKKLAIFNTKTHSKISKQKGKVMGDLCSKQVVFTKISILSKVIDTNIISLWRSAKRILWNIIQCQLLIPQSEKGIYYMEIISSNLEWLLIASNDIVKICHRLPTHLGQIAHCNQSALVRKKNFIDYCWWVVAKLYNSP